MKKVTANQPFYGSREEGQWTIGDTREVDPKRAAELEKLGLVSDPAEHAELIASQNKVLDDAGDKATADKLKSLSDQAKTAQKQADLAKASREKEAKDAADRKTKEDKEPDDLKTKAE